MRRTVKNLAIALVAAPLTALLIIGGVWLWAVLDGGTLLIALLAS